MEEEKEEDLVCAIVDVDGVEKETTARGANGNPLAHVKCDHQRSKHETHSRGLNTMLDHG